MVCLFLVGVYSQSRSVYCLRSISGRLCGQLISGGRVPGVHREQQRCGWPGPSQGIPCHRPASPPREQHKVPYSLLYSLGYLVYGTSLHLCVNTAHCLCSSAWSPLPCKMLGEYRMQSEYALN